MTTTLTVLRSSLRTVLAAVKGRLVDQTGIDASRVMIVARQQKKIPHLAGDQDILLRTGGFKFVPGIRDRHDARIRRQLSVILRTRWELDEADSDEHWLTDD